MNIKSSLNFTALPFSKWKVCIAFLTISLFFVHQEVFGQNAESFSGAVVREITFKGNDTYPDVMLSEYIATHKPNLINRILRQRESTFIFDRVTMLKDKIRIQRFYQRRGFPNATVHAQTKAIEDGNYDKVEVEFVIDEAEEAIVDSLRIVFSSTDTASNRFIQDANEYQRTVDRNKLKKGKRFEETLIADVEANFTNTLKNLGFAYTKVSLDFSYNKEKTKAELTITINSGPRAYFENIDVEGLETISDDYVIRESGIKKGRSFSLDRLRSAQREMFNHHLFQFATLSIPEQEHDSTLNLNIKVKEAKLRSIRFVGGIGLEEYLRAQIKWTHRNVFKRAHKFSVETTASFLEQRLTSSYLIPWVYNTHSNFILSPYVQRQIEPAYTLEEAGINNTLIYQHSSDFTTSISYNYSANQENLLQDDVSLPDTVNVYDISSIELGALFTQGYIKDKKGWVIRAGTEFSGLVGKPTFEFYKFNADVRHYLPISSKAQLAFKVQAGAILTPSKQDSLPSNIKFYLGGTSSVRGYGRQMLGPKRAYYDNGEFERFIPSGGKALFASSVEYRQRLDMIFKGFGVALFTDTGNVWESYKDIGDDALRWVSGFGFRYQSPVGPIRIDFGYKLNPSKQDRGYVGNEKLTKYRKWGIHFSLGQAF